MRLNMKDHHHQQNFFYKKSPISMKIFYYGCFGIDSEDLNTILQFNILDLRGHSSLLYFNKSTRGESFCWVALTFQLLNFSLQKFLDCLHDITGESIFFVFSSTSELNLIGGFHYPMNKFSNFNGFYYDDKNNKKPLSETDISDIVTDKPPQEVWCLCVQKADSVVFTANAPNYNIL